MGARFLQIGGLAHHERTNTSLGEGSRWGWCRLLCRSLCWRCSSRCPGASSGQTLSAESTLDALRLSVIASLSAVVVSVLVGVPLAVLLASSEFPLKGLVRAIVLLPLVLPPVVGGAALLFALGRSGLVGGPLYDVTGIVLPFSIWGVILAVSFVAVPFTVITVEGALRSSDPRFATAARSLGASPWTVLRRVTLPMVAPAVAAGLTLSWARAFGEFGATVAFAGSLAGETETLPLAVFVSLQTDRPAAIALSLMMVVVSVIVLLAMRDRWVRPR